MRSLIGSILIRGLLALVLGSFLYPLAADTKADRNWRRISHPILEKYCTSCHNPADKKAGLDLNIFYFIPSVIRHGDTWRKAVRMMENGEMPPPESRQMTQADKDSLIYIVNHILDGALAEPNPGPSVLRRLTHREYSYTIKDLMEIDFDARKYFPKEGSGGEGFDNQSRVLYMTPLMMERYYMAADSIIRGARKSVDTWQTLVPRSYRPNLFRRSVNRIRKIILPNRALTWRRPLKRAEKIIIPFAAKAFRGFMTQEEQTDLMDFFRKTYFDKMWMQADGFESAIAIMFKRILVSPMFLYRTEVNQPIHKPYAVSNLELATRLSYLLWSSMPDDTLIEVAYRENLHEQTVLNREARRMMRSPKFKRFSKSFAPQWLGVEEALTSSQPDPELFPEFTPELRDAMIREVVDYFHHVLTERKNLLELIDSEYSLINRKLAEHYDIEGVTMTNEEFRRVNVSPVMRGGILGMGAVLTATSLANRTSPVLRGQWILDQVLGTPAPPPPPDVPELSEGDGTSYDDLNLRELLEKHRAAPSCAGCHQRMDPLGFALENFDAVGRYRTSYADQVSIDTRSILENGEVLEGPTGLRQLLKREKEKFAFNFARKMLSYALGRGISFTDSPTINEIKEGLLASNFDSESMILNLVNSYPFRHRQSDMTNLYIKE